ncbi:hypothetical protein ScPMuIL_007475 [Solemya velum]
MYCYSNSIVDSGRKTVPSIRQHYFITLDRRLGQSMFSLKTWVSAGICWHCCAWLLLWPAPTDSTPVNHGFPTPCAPCTCLTQFRRLRFANCSKLALQRIPRNLPQDIDVLDLSFNHLRRHALIGIKKFVNLKYLNLAHSNIDIISGTDFADLELLQEIDLTGNHIIGISRKPFENLGERLRAIVGFEATRFQRDVFENLDRMKKLSIVFHQSPIPPDIFNPLKSLQHLQVSIMKSKAIPSHLFTFEGGRLLKNLQIEARNVIVIPETILQGLTELSVFTIIGGSLMRLPNSLFHGNGTDRKDNPVNIDEITIKGVKQLPKDLFQNQMKVRKIVLNGVSSIALGLFRDLTTLVNLEISDSVTGNISQEWFSGCVSLRALNLSHTNLTTIGLGTFSDLSSLVTLDISGNDIRYIAGDTFRPTRHSLTVLNISTNSLESLSEDLLVGMHKLEILDISHNLISSLPAGLLADAVILKRLYAQGNAIFGIPDSLFATQYDLLQVDFSDNNISRLEPGSFSNAFSMRRVFIDNNPLECGCPVAELFYYPGLDLVGTCRNTSAINATTEKLNFTDVALKDCFPTTPVTTLHVTHIAVTMNVTDLDSKNTSTISVTPSLAGDSVLKGSVNRATGKPDNPEMIVEESRNNVAMYIAVTAVGILLIVALSWVGIYFGRRYTRKRAYYTSGSREGRTRSTY